MSTKKIREVLEEFREGAQGDQPALWEAAVAELEAIEKMAQTIAGRKLDATEIRRSAELMQSIAENAPRR